MNNTYLRSINIFREDDKEFYGKNIKSLTNDNHITQYSSDHQIWPEIFKALYNGLFPFYYKDEDKLIHEGKIVAVEDNLYSDQEDVITLSRTNYVDPLLLKTQISYTLFIEDGTTTKEITLWENTIDRALRINFLRKFTKGRDINEMGYKFGYISGQPYHLWPKERIELKKLSISPKGYMFWQQCNLEK